MLPAVGPFFPAVVAFFYPLWAVRCSRLSVTTLPFEPCPLPGVAACESVSLREQRKDTSPVQCEVLVSSRSWLSRRLGPTHTPPPRPPGSKNNIDRVWVKASRAEGARRLHTHGLCPPLGSQRAFLLNIAGRPRRLVMPCRLVSPAPKGIFPRMVPSRQSG